MTQCGDVSDFSKNQVYVASIDDEDCDMDNYNNEDVNMMQTNEIKPDNLANRMTTHEAM